MSEEDTQMKSSTQFHESMKKGVDEITAEKEAVKGDKEITKNGLDTHKSENKQNSFNDESKENESKNIKNNSNLSDNRKEDEPETPMDGIENEKEPLDVTPNSDHDSLNDSKNETLEEVESTEESKLETLEDSRDESMIKNSRKGEHDDSFDQTPTRGKRERKKVERFVQETKKEEVEVEGHGTPLGDIPFIKTMIAKTSPENLKILHRICYARPGSVAEVKRNLYKFRGFPFSKDDKLYERKKVLTEKIVSSELKRILVIFGLERKGVKMDLIDRTLDFLLTPEKKQKYILKPKQSKKDKGKKRKRESGKKNKADEDGQGSDSDEDSKSEAEEEEEDDDDDDDEEEEKDEADDEEEQESESEEENVVKSKKKSTPKATPAPKKSKKPPPKKTPKAQPTKPQPKSSQKKKVPPSPSSSSDEDSEPLVKKIKKSPTDAEIKTYIKKLLDKADLEQVTMKKVCQSVYEHYPGQDLSYKKDFIKATVKSILS